MADPTQTIAITNFGGRLSRILNGDLNSGFAKFTNSFGYDPFSKPMNLTWLEQPVDISNNGNVTASNITDLILTAKTRMESNVMFVYAIGNSGKVYKIQPNTSGNPNVDTSSLLATLSNANMQFGASMDFFGSTEKIYIGQDDRVNSIGFTGAGETTVTTTGSVLTNVTRPLVKFVGKLLFSNSNNLGAVDNTGTVTTPVVNGTYALLTPGIPNETYITDLDVSPDGNYALISTSGVPNEQINTISQDIGAAAGSNGNIFFWNGSDPGITASTTIPSYALTALQTYLTNNMFFSNDSFGASLNNGTAKLITLPNNKSPLPNATTVNGNFICWISPEINAAGTGRTASMFYYGQLDNENPPGLWRVMQYTPTLANGFIYQVPLNILTNNSYKTVNSAATSIVSFGYGKHYFSTYEVAASNASVMGFKRFLVTSSGTGTPQLGVYETQTQLFSKRITIKQIRVYTEPTATSNGFQIDCIGSDGAIITNGTFNYTFAAGSDPTLVQGSLERIDFNPKMKDVYSLGLRVTNTGTTNMTIKKIEVDWAPSGK